MSRFTARVALLPLLLLASATAPSAEVSHFTECAYRTGKTATVIIPSAAAPTIRGEAIAAGAEIGVFTPEGTCAGAAVWRGGSMALAVWEDDPLTGNDLGFRAGQPLSFRVYDQVTGYVYGENPAHVVTRYSENYASHGKYETDAIFVISALDFTAVTNDETDGGKLKFALSNPFPNPFRQEASFSYSIAEDADVTLEVFDLLGRRVAVVVDERQLAGRYDVSFRPGPDVAAGMLIARMRAGGFSSVKRFTYMQ